MPHSTSDFSKSTLSMTSNPGFSSTSTSRLVGSGVNGGSSLDNKWRRASLPVSDMYSDHNGARGRSGSVVSTSSNAVYTRRPQYHDIPHHGPATTKDRVTRDAPLIAELRTNVIIKDEYTLVTDLSYHLAVRFTKPDSSIMVNIDHSSCLALAGTFDPCYILTITTLPLSLGPEANKRNAALIQAFMADILSVPPERGILRFNAVAEENYAINGSTIYGELERFDTTAGAENGRRAGPDARKSGLNLKKSTPDIDAQKTNGVATDREQRAGRRRSTMNDAAPEEVFELAADTDGHPSSGATAPAQQGGSRSQTSSRENLRGDTTRNTRPKSVAAPPNGSVSADTFADSRSQAKPKHISTVIRAEQKSAHMPPSAKTNARPISTTTNRQSTGTKSMTSATPAPVSLKETIVDNPKVLKAEDAATATPKPAKRRSTITATPKIPAAPPVPESKTPKVSKRKSFLSAFRR